MKILSPNQNIEDLSSGLYTWSPKKACVAWQKAHRELGEMLSASDSGRLLILVGPSSAGKSYYLSHNLESLAGLYDVVFDALFLTRVARRAVVNIAVGSGWVVDAVAFATPVEVCLKRAKKRSRRGVKPALIRSMHRNMQLPTKEEGLSRIEVL